MVLSIIGVCSWKYDYVYIAKIVKWQIHVVGLRGKWYGIYYMKCLKFTTLLFVLYLLISGDNLGT